MLLNDEADIRPLRVWRPAEIQRVKQINNDEENSMKPSYKTTLGMIAVAGAISVLASGCAPVSAKAEKTMKAPVNCSTAQGDLRVLAAEKANTAKEIGEGVSAIAPIGLVAHLVEGNEGETWKVATGDYNKMLDKKIAEIKSECNIK